MVLMGSMCITCEFNELEWLMIVIAVFGAFDTHVIKPTPFPTIPSCQV